MQRCLKKLLEYLGQYAGLGIEDVTDRDIGLGILTADYESQLVAIHAVLQRNRKAEKEAEEELHEIEEFIRKNHTPDGWVEHHWVDHLHRHTFIDAAHSMAAVGLIAPLMESLFASTFRYFRLSKAWEKARGNNGVAKGVIQVASEMGLAPHLPEDLDTTLLVLFAYRNKMFHCGLEWPQADRKKFLGDIRSNGWTECFSWATRGDTPWIFYLARPFIDRSLDIVNEVIEGIGAYGRTDR